MGRHVLGKGTLRALRQDGRLIDTIGFVEITQNEFKGGKLLLGHHIFTGSDFLGARTRGKTQIPGLDTTGLAVWTGVGMNGDKHLRLLLVRHSGSLC